MIVDCDDKSIAFVRFDDRTWKLAVDEQEGSNVSIWSAILYFSEIEGECSCGWRGLFIESRRQHVVVRIAFPCDWCSVGGQGFTGRRMLETKS